ncbi:MAG: hypothetical protein R3B40_22305 [Polyangiales bacterium]
MKTYLVGITLFGLVVAGCDDSPAITPDQGVPPDAHVVDTGVENDSGVPDEGTDEDQGSTADAGPGCVTSQVGAGAQNVAICPIGAPVRHVRLEGVQATRTHASVQLFLGLSGPVVAQEPLAAGQFKLQLYGGGAPQPPPDAAVYFGAEAVGFAGPHDFINSVSTVCFDVHPGSESARALVVLWVDGQHGADCSDAATLTYETRYGHAWAPEVGALDTTGGIYFYQSGGAQTPSVTLDDEPVLAYDAVPPPECTVSPVETTATERYVALCALDAPVQHVRLTDVTAADPHGTVSLLVGYAAPADVSVGPTAPSSTDQLRVQLYGGFAPHTTPRIDVHYEATSTLVPGDLAFVNGTSTLCLDIHDGASEAGPTVIVWRDGELGADCEDRSTLTLETAFAVIDGDDYGAVVGALDKSLPLYLYQNTGGSTGAVTLSTRSAVTL